MVVKELFAKLGLTVDETAFARGEAAIAGLRVGLAAFVSAAVAGLAVVGVGFAKHTAEAGDQARKLAASLGLDSIAIQEFAYAASLADISTEEMAISLRHLARTGVRDVRGEMLRLAKQFQSMPNDGRRVAFAMEKFGRAGSKMINLLKGGPEELHALMEEAHAFGNVISEEDQIASEEFNDQLTRLRANFIGVRNAIGLKLIRPLTELVVWLRRGVFQLRQLDPKPLIAGLKVLAAVALAAATAAFITHAGAIATAVSWYAALGVAALVNGAKMAAAWLIGMAPVTLLVVLIAALILAIEDVWVALHGGKSLIGELGPLWSKWIEDFYTPRKGDPPWLMVLKQAFELITGMSKLVNLWQLPDLIGKKLFGPEKYDATSPEAIEQRRKTMAAMGYAVSTTPAFSTSTEPGAVVQLPGMTGGAAGPQAAAARAVSSSPPTRLQSFKIDKVEVNATTGADPKQIANETVRAIDEHHKKTLREAASGIE